MLHAQSKTRPQMVRRRGATMRADKPEKQTTQKAEVFSQIDSVAYQLRDTYRVFLSLLQSDLKRYRIPTSGWFFLRVLWQEDGLSQKDLAARAGLLQSNSSAALKQMQRYGLIRQVVDRSDRRRVTIYLTPRARKLEKLLVPVAARLRDIAMRDFSPREQADLFGMLFRIKQNLAEHAGER
jgi:MarR family transcriptional regulator, organic hydroperoxide resistance regulator